jgi:hypothetical protein
MRVVEVDPIDLEELHQVDSQSRSEGLHLSTIIKDILVRRDSKTYGKEVTTQVRALWELGFVGEELMGRAMAHRYHTNFGDCAWLLYQYEIELDSILMTLDLFNALKEIVNEFKATKMTMREFQLPWHWLVQNKSYCHGVETCHSRFDVMFINGAYDLGKLGPVVFKAWEVEYSSRELRDNWLMVLNHRRFMRKEGLL